MGVKEPKLGLQGSGLASALFTTTQQRVLGLLFGQPDRSFYANELIALSGGGTGAVQRELARLEQAGLVTARRVGVQKHYQANPEAPIHDELVAIARKTMGLAEPIRNALAPLASHIEFSFVYGSIARQSDRADSDIDLFLVSDSLSHQQAHRALSAASDALGRPINPTIYDREEFDRGLAEGRSFIVGTLNRPKVWIFGSEDDIAPR